MILRWVKYLILKTPLQRCEGEVFSVGQLYLVYPAKRRLIGQVNGIGEGFPFAPVFQLLVHSPLDPVTPFRQ